MVISWKVLNHHEHRCWNISVFLTGVPHNGITIVVPNIIIDISRDSPGFQFVFSKQFTNLQIILLI